MRKETSECKKSWGITTTVELLNASLSPSTAKMPTAGG